MTNNKIQPTKNNWHTIAKIRNPERLKVWEEIVGGDTIPIKSIIPTWGGVEGFTELQSFYMLDFDALNPEQYENLKRFLFKKFSVLDVDVLLKQFGVPVLASDVTVSTTDAGVIASVL